MSFVRYGSRFLTKKRSTVGYLARYGSWLKAETENGVFLQRFGKRFSLKNGKRYGFRLRCHGGSKKKLAGPIMAGPNFWLGHYWLLIEKIRAFCKKSKNGTLFRTVRFAVKNSNGKW